MLEKVWLACGLLRPAESEAAMPFSQQNPALPAVWLVFAFDTEADTPGIGRERKR